jgi:hypothetical protein
MKKNTELIVDDAGLEILVAYRYERNPSQIEECHGYHEMGGGINVELEAVEVIVKGGSSVNILPFLNSKQEDYIIDKLNFDEL